MSWFWILLILAIAIFAVYTYTLQYSYRKMPNGGLVFPFIGSILSIIALLPPTRFRQILSPEPWIYFDLMCKKYGGICSGSLGKFSGVIIGDYDVLKEVENMDEYSIKVYNELTSVRSMGEELGLIFAATPELWIELRKFSQRTLRDFGFGKRLSMQSVIEIEITEIIKEFREEIQKTNGIMKIRTTFILSVLNVLWCMIAGRRYEHDDPKLLKMLDLNFAMTKSQTFADPLVLAAPFLRDLFPKLFNWDLCQKVYKDAHEYSLSLINERRAEGIYQTDPQNYIDCYLKKIDENDAAEKKSIVYTEKNLQMMIEDFLQTGSTTTVGTLNFAVLFLTLNPEIQKRCQAEIDNLVPRHLVPTMDDIEKMPYVQATMLETHRLGNVVPIPIPREVPKDWHYRGYVIPKGTYIVSNHYSVQMDEAYWGDPHTFRPDRFINDKGEFVSDKHVVQFGFGKRYCLGVTLANSVIPIYITALLQNFNFNVVPGTKPPTTQPEIGVSLSPKEFSVYVTPRD